MVNKDVTIGSRVEVTGNVYLILEDTYTLTVNGGIQVAGSSSLTIYGQENGIGQLEATGTGNNAAIGGNGGTITISGGTVTACGGINGARSTGGTGIGGSGNESCGDITITGGTVTGSGTWTNKVTAISLSGSSLSLTVDNTADLAAQVTRGTVTGNPVGTDEAVTWSSDPSNVATVTAGSTVNLVATANGGYRFTGWTSSGGGTFANASSESTTFTMPAGDVTVTARFTTTSSGGSSGGGSSGGSSPPVPPQPAGGGQDRGRQGRQHCGDHPPHRQNHAGQGSI